MMANKGATSEKEREREKESGTCGGCSGSVDYWAWAWHPMTSSKKAT